MDFFNIIIAGASLVLVLGVFKWLATPQPVIYVQFDDKTKPVQLKEQKGSSFGLLLVITAIVLFVLSI
jgi:hypothetical protein